ncbi:MAG: agmatinase family protein [Magnetococcales bacterium]|nr:agmatinase family protein [Magnetococcales bacterium]
MEKLQTSERTENDLILLPPSLGFLGLADDSQDSRGGDACRALVMPFGLEASVSYGRGTSGGPRAIIEASREVETFDCELWTEACDHFGLWTWAGEPVPGEIGAALALLGRRVEQALTQGYFPLILGGEHSLTPGAIIPFVQRHPDLVILHFDAHADLRDGYLGEHHSHASALRRCLDHPGIQVVSIGIRNISRSEAAYYERERRRIKIFWAHEGKGPEIIEQVRQLIQGRPVYLSFDLDAFDSSLMPATGTPEPGGLFWDDVMPLLRMAMRESRVLGADIVELAPVPGLHACDFLAARLAYRILSYRFADDRGC